MKASKMNHTEVQEENTLGMQEIENNYLKHGNNHLHLFSIEGKNDIKCDLLRSTAEINSDSGDQFLPKKQNKAKS